jgi:hypothetical protein
MSLLIPYQGCVFKCAVINANLFKGYTIVAKEKTTNNNSQPLEGLYIGRKDW